VWLGRAWSLVMATRLRGGCLTAPDRGCQPIVGPTPDASASRIRDADQVVGGNEEGLGTCDPRRSTSNGRFRRTLGGSDRPARMLT